MRLRTLFVATAGAAAFIATVTAQTPSASDLYQEALRYQDSKGDLVKAIQIYKTVIATYPKDAVTPKALFELASCYEKSGQPEATATYERLVREYGSSPSAAAARARLGGTGQKDAVVSVKPVWSEGGGTSWTTRSARSARVSPDGKYFSYVDWDTGNLMARELSTGRARQITSDAKGSEHFAEAAVVSPDSKSILYTWYDDKKGAYDVRMISRDGGQPRVVFPNDNKDADLTPIGWSANSQHVVIVSEHPEANIPPRHGETDVMMVPLSGGAPRLVKHFDDRKMSSFSISPGGDFVAFNKPVADGKPEQDIFVLSLADGSTWPLAPHIANDLMLDWFPAGDRLLFLSDRAGAMGVWSMAVSNGRAQGQPAPVRPEIGMIERHGFTSRGDYYYGLTTPDAGVQIATIDPATGRQIGALARLAGRYQTGQTQAEWSSTGDRIAYVQSTKFPLPMSGPGRETDQRLAIQTIATGEVKLLNLPMSNMQNPVWMPGDTAVLLQGVAQDGQGLYRVDLATGTMSPFVTAAQGSPLLTGPFGPAPSISPDGGSVYFMRQVQSAQVPPTYRVSLVARGLDSPSERTVVSDVRQYAVSPDSRWIAVSPRTATDGRILIYPSTGGEARTLQAGSESPRITPWAWSRDGRSVLTFRFHVGDENSELWQVPVDGGPASDTGIRIPFGGILRISVHPDGRRLAISNFTSLTATWVMTGLTPKK